MAIEFGIEKAKDGNSILVLKKDGQTFYLQSRYNPIAEAKKQAEKVEFKEKHIVIIGGGNPYYVKNLLHKIKKSSIVFYIEPYPDMMNFVINSISSELTNLKFERFIPLVPQLPDFEEKISSNFNLVELDKIDYAIHPIGDRYFKNEIDYTVEIINKLALQIVYDFITRAKDGRRVQKNILKNLDILVKSTPVLKLKNLFSSIPAVLVSAGPSLDKNIIYLKDFYKRGIIISTDTALRPLLSIGIEPHFVVAGDPSYFNYLHLKDIKTEKSFLVSEPSIDRRAFENFGERVFVTVFDKPLLEQIEEYIGEIGHLKTWGSVASLAVELARFIGSNPIYFLGQDLSYPYFLKYTRKTIYDSGWVYSRDNKDYLGKIENSIKNASDKKEKKDIFGRPVFTSFKMESYKEYLISLVKEEPDRFLNLTEGGIFDIKSDIAWKKLLSHKKIEKDNSKIIEKINKSFNKEERKKKLENFLKKTAKIAEKLEKEIKLFLEKSKKKKFFTEDELYNLYNKIYENQKFAEIIENYTQEPIYKLLKAINKYKENGDFKLLKNSFFEYYDEMLSLLKEIKEDFEKALQLFNESNKKGG